MDNLPTNTEFRAVVRRVQSLLGVPADYEVGRATWSAICRATNVTPAPHFTETVSRVQEAIGLPPKDQDGVAGINTWLHLEGFLLNKPSKKPSIFHPIKRTQHTMSEKLTKTVGSFIRTALAAVGGFLVAKGVVTPEQAEHAQSAITSGFDSIIAGVVAYAAAQVWSLIQKRIFKSEI